MIKYVINDIEPKEYIHLRERVNFHSFSLEQAEKALKNSLRVIVAKDEDKCVGMGRIVGDGAVICYLQDLSLIHI